MLYIPGIQANLLSAGQLKKSGVQLQGDGDEMLLIAATREVLGRARYNGRALCTDLPLLDVVAVDRVATGLDITPSTGADPPCESCVGGKLARHTFLAKGSATKEALAVVHIDLCGPFWVVAKDDSLYFLAKKSVLMLRSDRGGEFLGKDFTDFVDGKGIVHDLTCPYTPQQNGMAEQEMRTAVESVRTMLLHMGVQHHGWHLPLQQAVWERNCLERSTTPPGTTLYQVLTGKKPDLTLARVWGCMVQFMVLEQQRGGKLVPKARWELHLGVSPESTGWEVLDLTDNKVVTLVEAHPPTDTLTATFPLLAEVDEPADEDVVEALPPSPSQTGLRRHLCRPPAMRGALRHRLWRRPVALPAVDKAPSSTTGEQQIGEPVEQEAATGVQSTGELPKSVGSEQLVEGSKQLVDDLTVDEEGELSAGEESTDSDVVEVPITKPELRRTSRAQQPPERLSFHACLPPAAFTAVYDEVDDDMLYDDAEEDEELPELDPDMHADPEYHWDIATMMVKEALANWNGKAVKAAMEEEIRSLVGMGTWELVERPRGVNIMKNRWVLTTKYRTMWRMLFYGRA
ncbi:unnamed protein product [Closterium sp. NIES-54]